MDWYRSISRRRAAIWSTNPSDRSRKVASLWGSSRCLRGGLDALELLLHGEELFVVLDHQTADPGGYATMASRTAESHAGGLALMVSIRRRAIGEGVLSPASHFCTRIRETPSSRAKIA